jgi:chromosome segregation ATPase
LEITVSEVRVYCVNDLYHSMQGNAYVVCADAYTAAQSELAALREELTTSKRNEHNSEVAYKAAIEKQAELREDFGIVSEERDRAGRNASAFEERMGELQVENGKLQQRLTAAEQRNALMSKLLQRCIPVCRYKGSHTERALINEIETVLTKTTGSGASE